jgi:hypothetical protein
MLGIRMGRTTFAAGLPELGGLKIQRSVMRCRIYWIAVFVGLVVFSCSNDERELRDFYLRQSRDEALTGWWLKTTMDGVIWHITADGLFWWYSYSEAGDFAGKYTSWIPEYWYTKSDTLMRYEYHATWMYGSLEHPNRYIVKGDSLYFRNERNKPSLVAVRRAPIPTDSIGVRKK